VDKNFRALRVFRGQNNFVPFVSFVDKKISCPSWTKIFVPFVPFVDKKFRRLRVFRGQKISSPSCLSWTKKFVPFVSFVDKNFRRLRVFRGQNNFVPFVSFVDKKIS